jgi:hypothetical protein
LATTLSTIACMAGLLGCYGQTDDAVVPDRLLIVTRTPVGTARLHAEPSQRFAEGSEIAAIDLREPDAEPAVLSRGLISAGNPSITIDGRRILFIGRENGKETFSLFSSATDGSDRRLLLGEPYNCGGGYELPDGRIVFAATVEDGDPPPGFTSAWSLFVLSPSDGQVARISFSGKTEIDPFVLSDGRILYSQWLGASDGRPESGSFALFTLHPDGTGVAPLHGHHSGPAWKIRPRQSDDGDLFFVAAEPDNVARIDGSLWAAPALSGFSLHLPLDSPLTVEPASENRLLISTLTTSDAEGGLLMVDRAGQVLNRIRADDEEWNIVEAVEVRSRRRPQGQLSMIDPAGNHGYVLAIDARPAGPLGLGAAIARVRTASASAANSHALGDVPLAADGSFFAKVPADTPLLIDILDANDKILVETVSPIWVRPKEIRGCVGCHEDPETAPPNRRPLAVLEDPVDLAGQED